MTVRLRLILTELDSAVSAVWVSKTPVQLSLQHNEYIIVTITMLSMLLVIVLWQLQVIAVNVDEILPFLQTAA